MSLAASISRAFTPQSEWPDKEEFLDVIYWGRQVGTLQLYSEQRIRDTCKKSCPLLPKFGRSPKDGGFQEKAQKFFAIFKLNVKSVSKLTISK